MKHLIRNTFAALALAGSVLGLQAQVAVKVATVDLEQLFTKYYKTEAEIAKLNEQGKKAKEQVDGMLKEREALVTSAKELQEQVKSPVLTDDARKKAQADFEAKVGEIRATEQRVAEFNQEIQQRFQQKQVQFQRAAIEEISRKAADLAKAKGATLVVNQGALIYADPSFDITAEVLDAINKDRPAVAPTPAPEPAK